MRIGSEIWGDERKLRATFTALEQAGMGPAFGSWPIGPYQQHQVAALDVLTERLVAGQVCENSPERAEVRVRENYVQGRLEGEARWRDLGLTPACVWSLADKRLR